MIPARSPIIVIMLQVVGGVLVANGIVDTTRKDDFVNLAADVIGGLVYVLTTAYGLYQFFAYKKHNATIQGEVDKKQIESQTNTVTITEPSQTISVTTPPTLEDFAPNISRDFSQTENRTTVLTD